MLEVRVYHKESDTFSGQLEIDKFGSDFNNVLNNTSPCNYLTFDGKGINLIDENLKFYEDGEYIGYTLQKHSDGNREFEGFTHDDALWINTAPTLDEYPERLTLQFKDNCCKEIQIAYCNKYGGVDKTETITVTNKFVTVEFLRNYYRIYIYFTKTAEPYQYIRIESVIYGKIEVLNKFTQHNLIEEINVLSDDLPINQFEATVVIPDPDNISFEKKDALTIFSNNKYYGTFYIVDKQRVAKKLYTVKAQNSLTIADNTPYTNWEVFGKSCAAVSARLSQIMGINVLCPKNEFFISGDLKSPSCRLVLTSVGWALGYIVDTSRRNDIEFIPIPTEITSTILSKHRRIIGDAVLNRTDEISSAHIEYTHLALNSDIQSNDITVEAVPNQNNVYTFDKPTYVFSISNATIISKDIYSVLFYATADKVEINYANPIINTLTETVNNETATITNEKKYNRIKAVGIASDFISRATDIKRYIVSRGIVKAKIRLRNEKVGNLIQIETAWDGVITGIILKMNMTFGYEDIADIEVLEWSL